jgi:membrane fusion protein (multidrug efflux system)
MSFSKHLLPAAFALTLLTPAMASEPSGGATPPPADLEVEGLVGPEQEIDLAAPSEGLITEILVPEGSRVERGAVIARLADEEEQILYRTAELQSRKLQEDLAAIERLYHESAASRDDYKRALMDAQRAAAERDLHAIRLEKRKITAPCDAYILRLLKQPGESVQSMEKFAELVATDRLHITAYVEAGHLGRIPVGTRAWVQPQDSSPPVEGEVIVSDPVLDPGGKVFRVRVRVEDPERKLVPGTRTKLRLPVRTQS